MSPEQNPSRSFGRRSFLRASGTVAAAGFLAACGGNTGRGGGSTGGKAISQWYHQYGEAGTQQAALRYAKAYSKADVSVQWIPGDYDRPSSPAAWSPAAAPTSSSSTPDVQMAKSGQIVRLDDIIADVKSDFTRGSLAANSVRRQGLWHPHDRRPAVARLPQEPAGEGRRPAPDHLRRADRRLPQARQGRGQGPVPRPEGGSDLLASPLLWATGSELLTADHKVAFDTPATVEGLKKMRELYTQQDAAARRPHRLVGPLGVHPGPDGDAVVRPVGDARHPEGTGRRLRHRPPARIGSAGRPWSTTAAGPRA